MLKYISLLTPLIFGASGTRSNGVSIANLVLAYSMICAGIVFGFIALYIWAASTFGVITASGLMCVALLSAGALILIIKSDVKAKQPKVPALVEDDPLAKHIPDSLKNDPRVIQILEKIAENPVAASAGALSLGVLISRELSGD